jgi:hypothetical protein
MASRGLESRKIRTILIACGALLAIYLAIGSWVERIRNNKQAVENAWLVLKQNCDYRVELLADWGNFLRHYLPQAMLNLKELETVYNESKKSKVTAQILYQKEDLQKFVNLQQAVSDALQKMYALLNGYPSLLSNHDFEVLNSETEMVELQIVYASKALNQNIENYNVSLKGLPGGWVNAFLKYPSYYTFSLPAMVLTPKVPQTQ